MSTNLTVDENEVARSDVETMYSFLVHSCLSITRIGANSKVERVVIAPPCGECYSCKRPLETSIHKGSSFMRKSNPFWK